MMFFNLKVPSQKCHFKEVVLNPLGKEQGLFLPCDITMLPNIDELLELDFLERSFEILKLFVSEDLDDLTLKKMITRAFNFRIPLVQIDKNKFVLELFHGPSLAFKDFGVRFLAQCLSEFGQGRKITILTATSGDTGGAVANAFVGLKNVDVVILYPLGKISSFQEKLMCNVGPNIRAYAVEGNFDDCQKLVKDCFDDQKLVSTVGLNSANSINVARLLAQMTYYFEAMAQVPIERRKEVVLSIPSGNFGNVTAALMTHALGLPFKKMIPACNVNDTVPRFIQTKIWSPRPTRPTLSNAMDISHPNNWPRALYLLNTLKRPLSFCPVSISDEQTIETLLALWKWGYETEPHTCVALRSLDLKDDEFGIALSTAHPLKFKEDVESLVNCKMKVSREHQVILDKKIIPQKIKVDLSEVKKFLM